MKIKEYLMVEASQSTMLVDDVNVLIDRGWQPLGGPCTSLSGMLRQAMVLYEKKTWIFEGMTRAPFVPVRMHTNSTGPK